LLLIVTGALLAVVVPFALLGPQWEGRVEGWLRTPLSPAAAVGIVCGALASDILLPIPSSAVSTFAGARLGLAGGAAASWLGMTAGACLGFALARLLGRPLAVRLAGQEDAERMDALVVRSGPAILVFTRALPVLAEAAVLVLGAGQLSWRRFLPPVVLANLGLSVVYAAFGSLADQRGALPWALAASVALPLAAAAVARLYWSRAKIIGAPSASNPPGPSGECAPEPAPGGMAQEPAGQGANPAIGPGEE
jgi:uncharacterized membrane protein YdjX (TVP38/TMEM64 family)